MTNSEVILSNAERFYVIERMTEKEVAQQVGVHERTIRRWKKEGKSLSIKFIEFIESEENDMLETEKTWKNLTITNKVFKIFCMIQENTFITKYRNALINRKKEEG